MKHPSGKASLVALSFLCAVYPAQAGTQETNASAMPAGGSPAAKVDKGGEKTGAINAVDINSAGKAELKTLPGIDDAAARRIIAGRPYPSKAFLVTRNVISPGVYAQIRKRIIAIQK